MDLWAKHAPLPLLGEGAFRLPEEAPKLVTLLNRTLKKKGLIFGLRRLQEGKFVLSIYDISQEGLHGHS
ncbi:MAG: hypothetical protein PWP58_376 [Bacillota bacterium]|jgi:hypothetical protein|nr:hypothetical protein [Bacillota bacterium]